MLYLRRKNRSAWISGFCVQSWNLKMKISEIFICLDFITFWDVQKKFRWMKKKRTTMTSRFVVFCRKFFRKDILFDPAFNKNFRKFIIGYLIFDNVLFWKTTNTWTWSQLFTLLIFTKQFYFWKIKTCHFKINIFSFADNLFAILVYGYKNSCLQHYYSTLIMGQS